MKSSSGDGEKSGLGRHYTLVALLLLGCLLVWSPDFAELKKKLVEAFSLLALGAVIVKLLRVELE